MRTIIRIASRHTAIGYAQTNIAPGSQVVSDGLRCFGAFDAPTYTQERFVTCSGYVSAQTSDFNWVNKEPGYVKNAITGSEHTIRVQHVRAKWPNSATSSINATASRPCSRAC